MTPERYQQIGALFDAALACAPAERARLLAQACGADVALREEVAALLANHQAVDDFLERPALQIAARLIPKEQLPKEQLEPINIGTQIGNYQICSLLGVGGMGRVYLAQDVRLGRKLALKVLPPNLTQNVDLVRRFKQEAKAVVALNHPNILTVHDFGQADGTYYLATEFIEGQTLRQRMQARRQTLSELLDLAVQIASALAAAHAAGVIHRDIKPENVMIRPDGVVKVLDFGLARITKPASARPVGDAPASTTSLTAAGTVFGTAAYMSPEQAKGERLDERTDLFSFGVLLYELCAGQLPFNGEGMVELLFQIIHRDPAPLSELALNLPAALLGLIERALAKEREQRCQTATEMWQALMALKQG